MARTEFVGSQSGGASVPREGTPDNGGSRPVDLAAIDARLNEIDTQGTELTETARSTSGEQRTRTSSELASGPRELLSESTDLNTLMAAILGEEAGERAPLEPAAPSRPVEISDDVSDALAPWRQELTRLLAEQPLREDAITPPAPAPTVAEESSAQAYVSALLRRWRPSRLPVLVGALAIMTFGVLAWQSGKTESAALSTAPPAVGTTAEPITASVPGSGVPPVINSAGETTGSVGTTGGAARPLPASPPRVSSAGSSGNTRVRTPAPPSEARQAVPAPARLETSPSVPARPLESASTPAVARAPEPPPPGIETAKPSQPTTAVAASATGSVTTAAPNAASPAAPVTPGGAVAAPSRLEPRAVAPAIAIRRTEPRLLRRTLPEYPTHLRQAKVAGSVTLTLSVDAQGQVVNVRAINGPNLLRPAAQAAAQRWRFEPATLNGAPVESSVDVTFNFNPSGVPEASR